MTNFVFLGKQDQIQSLEELESANLFLNRVHSFIGCTQCHAVVRDPVRHLKEHKTLKFVPNKDRELISTRSQSLGQFQIPVDGEPVQGLLVYRGWKCNHCEFLSQSEKGIKQHHSESHRGFPVSMSRADFQEDGNRKRFQVILPPFFLLFLE